MLLPLTLPGLPLPPPSRSPLADKCEADAQGREADWETAAAELAGCRGTLTTCWNAGRASDEQFKGCNAARSALSKELVACGNKRLDAEQYSIACAAQELECSTALKECGDSLAATLVTSG